MEKGKIIELYNSTNSIKQTAAILEVSNQKVRKILISEGLYSNETLEKITDLHERGLSISDISKILKITKNCIMSYLPYLKGIYKTDNPTKNALAIRKYRNK